jgi:hypothetical protein
MDLRPKPWQTCALPVELPDLNLFFLTEADCLMKKILHGQFLDQRMQ